MATIKDGIFVCSIIINLAFIIILCLILTDNFYGYNITKRVDKKDLIKIIMDGIHEYINKQKSKYTEKESESSIMTIKEKNDSHLNEIYITETVDSRINTISITYAMPKGLMEAPIYELQFIANNKHDEMIFFTSLVKYGFGERISINSEENNS
jgi:type IV secretory pathway VirB6-like protein